jgi:hypothetical protein
MVSIHGMNRIAEIAPDSIQKIATQSSQILLCGAMGIKHTKAIRCILM